MSIRVMTTVWEHSKASGTDLLVLLALADIADENGECWPSIGYIARKCRVDSRTAQRRIRSLEQLGEVVVMLNEGRARKAGETRSNRYRITVHLSEEVGGNLPPTLPGDAVTPSLAQTPPPSLAQTPPDTPLLPVKESPRMTRPLSRSNSDARGEWAVAQ